mgnify:CR=1 FL=1
MKNQLHSILNYSLIAFFLIATISCSNDPSKKIDERLFTKMGETFEQYLNIGNQSAAIMTDLRVLEDLVPVQPSGMIPGSVARMFPSLDNAAAMRQSIVSRIAPLLRVEGSGSTSDVEFDFSPDVNAETGDYEFRVVADDGEGGKQQVQLTQTINVQNNAPEIEIDDVPLEFEEGETIDFGVEVTDVEGGTPSVVWYADCEGQCTEADEIGTGSNFSFANSLAPGDHTIKVRILDSEGGYKEQEYNIVVKAAPESASLVETAIADLSNNLPLFASAGIGLVMILGTLLFRRRSSAEPVVEGLVVDDGVSTQQQNQQL